jgi:hypothetical protein
MTPRKFWNVILKEFQQWYYTSFTNKSSMGTSKMVEVILFEYDLMLTSQILRIMVRHFSIREQKKFTRTLLENKEEKCNSCSSYILPVIWGCWSVYQFNNLAYSICSSFPLRQFMSKKHFLS